MLSDVLSYRQGTCSQRADAGARDDNVQGVRETRGKAKNFVVLTSLCACREGIGGSLVLDDWGPRAMKGTSKCKTLSATAARVMAEAWRGSSKANALRDIGNEGLLFGCISPAGFCAQNALSVADVTRNPDEGSLITAGV